MDPLPILLLTAASIGVVHTLIGPDHYVPFVAMARVGGWSLKRTWAVTALCGVGHVLGSIALGAVGIAAGWALERLEGVEAQRGDAASWLLLGFGLAYLAWGLRQAYLNRPHTHIHAHADGTVHTHEHTHAGEHAHPHAVRAQAGDGARLQAVGDPAQVAGRMTPWVLFTIFAFGPCEPLIPLLMFPAAERAWSAVAAVSVIFAAATIGTMLTCVTVGYVGLRAVSLAGLERYSHALAGAALVACGLAIRLGL